MKMALMDQDRLRLDLEYMTQLRRLPEGETLRGVLARLDVVAAETDLPGQLTHYLTKRSYVKALAWLDDPSTPHQP